MLSPLGHIPDELRTSFFLDFAAVISGKQCGEKRAFDESGVRHLYPWVGL